MITIEDHLKQAGCRLTQPRRLVFELLAQHHPTSIKQLVDQTSNRADRASIYRSLSLFRELGVIQDIIHGGRKMIELTDKFDPHHHHIFCVNCHHSISIDDERLENYLSQLAYQAGFDLTGHQLELSGVCQNCR